MFLTHDLSTATRFAYEHVACGELTPGVFGIRPAVPVREAIEEIILVAICSFEGEREGQAIYLPFR